MKQLEIIQGTLYLDGEKVPCVKSFNLSSSSKTKGNKIAELTICIDVTMVSKELPESK